MSFPEIICTVESTEHGRIVVGTTDGLENAESVPDGYIHGVMKVDRKVKINLRFGETATIVCDEGYILHGTDSITCTQHGFLRVPLCMLVELDCQCEGNRINVLIKTKYTYHFVNPELPCIL